MRVFGRPIYCILAIYGFYAAFLPPLIAQTLIDKDYGFTLRLPDGFVARPDLVNPAHEVIHAYLLDETINDVLPVHLFVLQYSGTIGQHFRLEDTPAGKDFRGKTFTVDWKDFELEAAEVQEQMGNQSALTYSVSIPLKARAIQIKLLGPANRQSQLNELLRHVIDGIEGQSNWTSPDDTSAVVAQNLDPIRQQGRLLGFLLILLTAMLISRFVWKKKLRSNQ